jgi:hypothetical protein
MSGVPVCCDACGEPIKGPPAAGYGFCDGCFSVVEVNAPTDVFAHKLSDLVVPPAVAREAAMLRAKLIGRVKPRPSPPAAEGAVRHNPALWMPGGST